MGQYLMPYRHRLGLVTTGSKMPSAAACRPARRPFGGPVNTVKNLSSNQKIPVPPAGVIKLLVNFFSKKLCRPHRTPRRRGAPSAQDRRPRRFSCRDRLFMEVWRFGRRKKKNFVKIQFVRQKFFQPEKNDPAPGTRRYPARALGRPLGHCRPYQPARPAPD